jgi:2-polyprenyl-3-methyl-5-hydroxy-6-metoxy-1,4-benzoquinol methylase
MTVAPQLDPERVKQVAGAAFGALGGAFTAGMIYIGGELGLYRAMANAGPLTSTELAARTGLHERWVREWLRGQGAAGLIDYKGGERFELSPEGALCLVDEATPASVIGAFNSFPQRIAELQFTPESFRTGRGRTYDDGGEAHALSVEGMLGPWNRSALLTDALPGLPGIVERLQAGGTVCDMGCGSGVALLAMAKAFPKTEFHGYDNSVHALARARLNLQNSGVTNVHFHNSDHIPLPSEPTFDLVMCLDCLHDMTRPDIVAAAIRKAIRDDGTWFIVDVECSEDYEENTKLPTAATLYAVSVMSCLSSSTSSEDGLALGTAGLPATKMERLVNDAGFTHFERVAGIEHPFSAYYRVTP